MAQKSPYEIRLEVLQMAKDYMDNLQKLTESTAKQAVDLATKQGAANLEAWQALMPKSYSLEDLTTKANELYSFVVAGTGAKNV